jgi:hypothetical protein
MGHSKQNFLLPKIPATLDVFSKASFTLSSGLIDQDFCHLFRYLAGLSILRDLGRHGRAF